MSTLTRSLIYIYIFLQSIPLRFRSLGLGEHMIIKGQNLNEGSFK